MVRKYSAFIRPQPICLMSVLRVVDGPKLDLWSLRIARLRHRRRQRIVRKALEYFLGLPHINDAPAAILRWSPHMEKASGGHLAARHHFVGYLVILSLGKACAFN